MGVAALSAKCNQKAEHDGLDTNPIYDAFYKTGCEIL